MPVRKKATASEPATKTKYNATKVVVDAAGVAERLTTEKFKLRKAAKIDGDQFFDSVAEYEVWKILVEREARHEIIGLVRQPRYELLETTRIDGVTYHKTEYVADFEYREVTELGAEERITVVDVKGFPTPEAKLKAKLFRVFYRTTHKLEWIKWTKSRGIELMKYGENKRKGRK